MAFPKVKRYGWKPDHPDQRDVFFSAPPKVIKALPPNFDMRAEMPPVFNQGNLGSCTANAACALVWYLGIKEGHDIVVPSRLFEYYNTRLLEGTTRQDSGASIRDAIKAMTRWGFCPESDWPYNIAAFAKKPPQAAYKDATKNIVRQYHAVPKAGSQIKAALSQGNPVDFGFTVYQSFEGNAVASTGIVPMPLPSEQVLGGHSVLIVGYDDANSWYIVRNSWGEEWGDKGYCYMPYQFIEGRNASDFWTINAVP